MPNIRDLLPPPPWEGPPLPRYLVSQGPSTFRQRRLIAILCAKLGLKEPLEERVMTFGEAGRLIRELEAQERHRKGLKGGGILIL